MKSFVAGILLFLGVAVLFLCVPPFDKDSNALILVGALLCASPVYGYINDDDMIFAPGAIIKRGRKNEPARMVGLFVSILIFSICLAKALALW